MLQLLWEELEGQKIQKKRTRNLKILQMHSQGLRKVLRFWGIPQPTLQTETSWNLFLSSKRPNGLLH